MAHILLIIVIFGNLKAWSDSPFNVLSTHNASQLRNVSRYGINAKFCRGEKWASCPTYGGNNAHAVGKKRPEVEKLMIIKS